MKRCTLPKDSGPCKIITVQYYYDQLSGICQPFFYGGCAGNENRFDSMNECLENCSVSLNLQEIETNDVSFSRHDNRLQNDVPAYVYEERGFYPSDNNYLNDNLDKLTVSGQSTSTFNNIISSTTLSTFTFRNVSHDSFIQDMISKNWNWDNVDGDEDDDDDANDRGHKYEPSSIPELCLLPEDVGPCFGQILRWRYNSENDRCETFLYSGCGHNANYFTSEEACLRACGEYRNKDVCVMMMDRGNCELGVTKWYYNMDAGQCHLFIYSGCAGNGNRFSSKAECENLCSSELRFYASSKAVDICMLERDSGPCADPVTQWYFDSRSLQCMQFTYGGCRGNANRFNSKELCQKKCLWSNGTEELITRNEDSCLLPFEAGPCQDTQTLWYFDKSHQYCKSFIYSGCGGNLNRFINEEECLSYCSVHISGNRAQVTGPEVILIGYNPAPLGSTITLRCKAKGQYLIRWYKDGSIFQVSKGDRRIHIDKDNNEVRIISVHESDVGNYSCSVGRRAFLSNSIHLVVKETEVAESCVDQGNKMTCRLIVKARLCLNPRYGSFCCQTCASSNNSTILD